MPVERLTDTTGYPVCAAVRSAALCRVPDSAVGSPGSGTRCTLARRIRRPSVESTTAPSIFDSSRSLVGEKPTSSSNPPSQTASSSAPYPSTISPPVRARRMRSIPSRSSVPGTRRAIVRAGSAASAPVAAAPVSGPAGVRNSARPRLSGSRGNDTGRAGRCGFHRPGIIPPPYAHVVASTNHWRRGPRGRWRPRAPSW